MTTEDISNYAYGGLAFTGTVIDGSEIQYSYSNKSTIQGYVDISYVLNNTDVNLTGVFYSNVTSETQRIANNLPHWMALRQDPNSVGQTLINSWSQNLDNVKNSFKSYRKNQFLGTAELHNDINYAVCELPLNSDGLYKSVFKNLLYNSSFSIKSPSRYDLPAGWATPPEDETEVWVNHSIRYEHKDSLFGTSSIMLDGERQAIFLKQRRDIEASSGFITFSIFFKVLKNSTSSISAVKPFVVSPADATYHEPDEAGIILQLEYADSTVHTFGTGFTKEVVAEETNLTEMEDIPWNRTFITTNIQKELKSFNVIISNNNGIRVLVDLPQVELSSSPTDWTSSINDVHPFQNGNFKKIAGVQVIHSNSTKNNRKKLEVFSTSSIEEFVNIKVPTRIDHTFVYDESLPTVNISHGSSVNFYAEEQPIIWAIRDGKISEKSLTTPDIFNDFLPAELVYTENGDLRLDISAINNNNILIKAVTILDGTLFCISKETHNQKDKYYLKIVSLNKESMSSSYLQTLHDIEIPVTLGDKLGQLSPNEDVIRLGFCKAMPNVIFVDTNLDRRFYFKLYYDYYFADLIKRKLYCREDYSSEYGKLHIIQS